MRSHSADTQGEARGDFLISEPAGDQPQKVDLSGRQPVLVGYRGLRCEVIEVRLVYDGVLNDRATDSDRVAGIEATWGIDSDSIEERAITTAKVSNPQVAIEPFNDGMSPGNCWIITNYQVAFATPTDNEPKRRRVDDVHSGTTAIQYLHRMQPMADHRLHH